MIPPPALKAALAILLAGILLGILLGASELARPLLIIVGIIAGGRILLPLVLRRNGPRRENPPGPSGGHEKERSP
jgi:hypothetical protein